jgi:hypothetical protein
VVREERTLVEGAVVGVVDLRLVAQVEREELALQSSRSIAK